MIKKNVLITDKKGQKYEFSFNENPSPVTIEYAINCSAINYSNELLREIDRHGINIDDILSVKYLEDIERYEPNQGKDIKNRL